jgi:5-methylcytosine-specific restriction endonuclease McrA
MTHDYRPSQDEITAFYASRAWLALSYKAKLAQGRRCQCCGASALDGAQINTDHIKPIRTNWELRLDIKNLQVLCAGCNIGKGSWDQTDHRMGPPSSRADREHDEVRAALKTAIIDAYSFGGLSQEMTIKLICDIGLVNA